MLSIIDLLRQITYYLPSAILIILKFPLIIVLGVYFSLTILFNTVISVYYYQKLKRTETLQSKDYDLLPTAIKLSLINIIPLLAANIDKILLPLFLSFEELAIFGVALIIPQNLFSLTRKLNYHLFFKKAGAIKKEKLKEKLIKNSIWILLGIIVSTGTLWFITPFAIKILFTETYLLSVPYAQFLILFIGLTFISELFKIHYEAGRKIKNLLVFETIPYMFQIVLSVILIPVIGVWGAAIAKSIIYPLRILVFFFHK